MTFGSTESVSRSGDFLRIAAIRRRTLSDQDLEYIRAELTAGLRRPGGKMELRPKQAQFLHDIGINNGGVGVIRVGGGKTLCSLLAPAMLSPEPRRPRLVTKAALIDKTKSDRDELRKHWLLPAGLDMISYEVLGRISGAKYLEEQKQPDLIILDEAHLAKNLKAGVTKRLVRYIKERPDTRVVVMSGTLFKASLKDAAHLITWALKMSAPVPSSKEEIEQWANALDADSRVNVFSRVKPGALMDFVGPEDWADGANTVTAARRGFQRRLVESPGVVATGGDQVACSLNIHGTEFTPNAATEANFVKLRTTWQTPDDWELMQAVEVWACARQLAVGMNYIWDPRPPDEWRNRRKAWAKFVRETLKANKRVTMPRKGEELFGERLVLDTPAQVANAARAGVLHDDGLFAAWEAVRPTFTPNTKAVWHDDTVLNICQEWAEKTPGIVWTEHSFFAKELSRRTGLTYFGRDGKDAQGNSLDPLALRVLNGEEKPRAIICSIKANATGRNLQGWNENLISSIPTEAALWEQMLGRTHRDGQRSDEVNVRTLFGCHEHIDGWHKALELAQAVQDTEGSSQKLLMATCTVPPVEYKQGLRWQKTSDEDSTGT